MKLRKMPNANCLVYSAAMVLNVEPNAIFEAAGHNGMEVWWPNQPKPNDARGFHIDEINYFAYTVDRIFVPFSVSPRSSPDGTAESSRPIWNPEQERRNYINRLLNMEDAILITENHAVAFDHIRQLVYDPNGIITDELESRYDVRMVLVCFNI